MAWYYGKYTCGHEGRTNIVGPTKNRQWLADREFGKMCPDCWEVEKEEAKQEANRKAVEEAEKMELPELTGTEKQVAWAMTIRQEFIDGIDRVILDIKQKIETEKQLIKSPYYSPWLSAQNKTEEEINQALEKMEKHWQGVIEKKLIAFNWAISKKTEARYWIDNRDVIKHRKSRLLELLIEDMNAEDAVEEDHEVLKEIETESTLYPDSPATSLVAEIGVKENVIEVSYPSRDENLREIVKSAGFQWTGVWSREINPTKTPAVDLGAEIGSKLLAVGYPIRIKDKTIRDKVINGDYEPECKRWIMMKNKGKYANWFSITWYGEDDFYPLAKRLPGSRWDSPSVVVPSESYEEVLDFAKMYGFKLSKGARDLVDQAENAKNNALIVTPKTIVSDETKPLNKPAKLDVPDEVTIDDEFRD